MVHFWVWPGGACGHPFKRRWACSVIYAALRHVTQFVRSAPGIGGSDCFQDYAQNIISFEALSGAVSVPGVLDPDETDEDIIKHVQYAETQAVACISSGRRYWRASAKLSQLQVYQWLSLIPSQTVNAKDILLKLNGWFEWAVETPKAVRTVLCVPHNCTRSNLNTEIVPLSIGRWLLRFTRQDAAANHIEWWTAVPPYGTGFGGNQVRELGAWTQLEYDFVIAGVDACGTTSLHRNLAEHPGIAFSSNDEDAILHGTAYLPLKWQVDEFNSRWSLPSKRGKLRGIYSSNLFNNAGATAKASMKNPIVLLVACDPVSRFDTLYARHAIICSAGDRNTSWGNHCVESLGGAIRDKMFNKRAAIALGLKRFVGFFASKIFAVHQTHLRQDGRKAYRALAEEGLKLKSQTWVPSETRWNSVGPRRSTDLCKNASLLLRLKRRLATDVIVVRNLISLYSYRTPDEVLLGETRCDRIKLGGGREVSECYPKRWCWT